MYLVIICNNNSFNGYIYKDGYCYYSIAKYDKNSNDPNGNVVGAIKNTEMTRKKYNLPESFKDFEKYVINNELNGETKLNNFKIKMINYCQKILEANKGNICIFKNIKNSIKFGIYAMDIEIDKDFNPYIFEANCYFTRFNMQKRLGHMVANMYNDIYYKIGISNKEINGMWAL